MNEMKRILLILMLSITLPFVTACDEMIEDLTDFVTDFIGDDNNNSDNDTTNNDANNKAEDGVNRENEKDDQKSEDSEKDESTGGAIEGRDAIVSIFEKAKEAAKTVENQEVYITAHQVFDYGYFSMDSVSDFIVHVSYDPLVMYQYGFTKVDGETLHSKMYIEGDDIYVYMDMIGSWINLGGLASMFTDEETVDAVDFQSAEEQLFVIENSLEHFTLEETDTSYVFRLDAEGEGADAVYRKFIEGHSGSIEDMLEADQDLNEAVIKNFEYIISFNKKSFHADFYSLEFELGLPGEEQFKIIHQANSEFVNINEMGPVTVPDDVKESTGFPW